MANHFYEPWRARKSTTWKCQFTCPPDPEDLRAAWEESKAKVERDAPWNLLATGVWTPGDAVDLTSGKIVHADSTGTITIVHRVATERGKLDAEAFAKRIAACINFCAGIDLSETGFDTLREAIAEIKALRDGISRDTVNDWWAPKLSADPEVDPELGPPQGTATAKPRHQKIHPNARRRGGK